MRSYPADYELISPGSLNAVLQLMNGEPGEWTPIAGGTEIMVQFGAGKLAAHRLVNLGNLPELRDICEGESTLSIGGGCTFTQIRRHAAVQQHFPLLAQCAAWTGSIANQNRGTLAGNLANASPAADSPPALLAYDAEVELVSTRGSRRIAYDQFHLGYKKTALAGDELILAVHLPKRFAKSFRYARKVGARNAQAISKICVAATGRLHKGRIEEICIGMGSVAPVPLRLRAVERTLLGARIAKGETVGDEIAGDELNAVVAAARRALLSEVAPIDDIRSTAEYRKLVAANLLEELLRDFAAWGKSR